MQAFEYRPRNAKMVNSALCNLYVELRRNCGEGLEHVEALLRLRGIEPDNIRVPEKRKRIFRRGQLWRAVLEILRDGPMPSGQIAARLIAENPDKCPKQVRWSMYMTLRKLRTAGLVTHEGRLWERA